MVTVGPMVGTGHAWVTFQPPSLPLLQALDVRQFFRMTTVLFLDPWLDSFEPWLDPWWALGTHESLSNPLSSSFYCHLMFASFQEWQPFCAWLTWLLQNLTPTYIHHITRLNPEIGTSIAVALGNNYSPGTQPPTRIVSGPYIHTATTLRPYVFLILPLTSKIYCIWDPSFFHTRIDEVCKDDSWSVGLFLTGVTWFVAYSREPQQPTIYYTL